MDLVLHAGLQNFRYPISFRLPIGLINMDFLLQFGYGMMDHSRVLIKGWGSGTVILSPRDLKDNQLEKISSEVRAAGGAVLLDPQFYLPYSDHFRLSSHDYWPNDYESMGFWSGPALRNLLQRLAQLNSKLGCVEIILPGLYASRIDDDWVARQLATIAEADVFNSLGLPQLMTVALASDVVRDLGQIHRILDESAKWDVAGFYVICEHPNGDYLVEDPTWMANVLDLVAGLRLKGKKVILGYCNHQMLIAALAGASGIASGTWMNVRSFPPDKFKAQYEEEIKQRSTWYYCPQALSEYKISYLDIASRTGVLSEMKSPVELGSTYADGLFKGVSPSSIGFTEQLAFRHYLQCLRAQTQSSTLSTFDQTLTYHLTALDDAEALVSKLRRAGVLGQGREFREAVDASRAALTVLEANRGPMLRRFWRKITT